MLTVLLMEVAEHSSAVRMLINFSDVVGKMEYNNYYVWDICIAIHFNIEC